MYSPSFKLCVDKLLRNNLAGKCLLFIFWLCFQCFFKPIIAIGSNVAGRCIGFCFQSKNQPSWIGWKLSGSLDVFPLFPFCASLENHTYLEIVL